MKFSETHFRSDNKGGAVTSQLPAASATPSFRADTTPCRTRNMERVVDATGICTLTFDRPNSAANIFDRDTLQELHSHLDWIEHEPDVRGLIITSAKENIFMAGADIHALGGMADRPASAPAEDFRALIEYGQSVFNQLSSLRPPTVAVIHGACVGGGCELALACSQRLASNARATKIGLPEIKLGIIPAWGGCTRLPRLIGLPKALSVILAGKVLPAERALKLGMIDEVAPRETLLEVARRRLLDGVKPHRVCHRIANNPVSAMLIRTRAERELAARTRGNYPAPFEALEVATHGVSLSLEESLEREREAVLRLVQTQACRNLLRLFLLREGAKKPHAAPATPRSENATSSPRSPNLTSFRPISRAAVVGAGVMGAGIAQWLASRGVQVILRDVSLEQLVRGIGTVSQLFEDAVRGHHLTSLEARAGMDRVFAAATDVPMRDVDLVVEAATETLVLKQDIFRCLAAQTSHRAILATNTSALSIDDIASATTVPERVVGLHFFNPVPRMELVEVVTGAKTSTEVLARTVEFARRIGKVPVVVKDSPGFIVNRILMPYLVEAVRLFDARVAARDIDEAMLDFGMPMGPMRLLDEVGLDVAAHVVKTLAHHFPDRIGGSSLLDEMIAAGMLGKKSGHGFYHHAEDKPNHAAEALRGAASHFAPTSDEIAQRLSLLMVNEAARCLEEGVAASAADIDLAMVLGTGFAPFRGGPLRYADTLGIASVVSTLDTLVNVDPRFAPCDLLRTMAATNKVFYPTKGNLV